MSELKQCAHSWHDFGALGGRNVSRCAFCDMLVWTGKEPEATAPAPSQFGSQELQAMIVTNAIAKLKPDAQDLSAAILALRVYKTHELLTTRRYNDVDFYAADEAD